ncbi:hypothetical protein [Candidatus Carsonella ruddii]|uniref:Uncharacterized protein n=1 Tax=Candidatus Carsonella ruddii (Diaphorina cf. continua) TaxID=2661587 RepID=A0A7R6VYF0_CARRU|nr:hypothetical protein [Candidatus Carsonella ruddii (Diaphorina cf. continua)]BCG49412.1 hypothetical protein CRDco_1850 [Candidatus Carsonella ruddii (Diaphorina cf. continua)]
MDFLKINNFFFNYLIIKKEKILNKLKKTLIKNLLTYKKVYYLYYLKIINKKILFISKKFNIKLNYKIICY